MYTCVLVLSKLDVTITNRPLIHKRVWCYININLFSENLNMINSFINQGIANFPENPTFDFYKMKERKFYKNRNDWPYQKRVFKANKKRFGLFLYLKIYLWRGLSHKLDFFVLFQSSNFVLICKQRK